MGDTVKASICFWLKYYSTYLIPICIQLHTTNQTSYKKDWVFNMKLTSACILKCSPHMGELVALTESLVLLPLSRLEPWSEENKTSSMRSQIWWERFHIFYLCLWKFIYCYIIHCPLKIIMHVKVTFSWKKSAILDSSTNFSLDLIRNHNICISHSQHPWKCAENTNITV